MNRPHRCGACEAVTARKRVDLLRLTRWALSCIGECMPTARSQAFSLGLHVLLALLLLAAAHSIRAPLQPISAIHTTPLTLFRPRQSTKSRGGGSNHTALPARRGSPPPTAHRTFIPPTSSDHLVLALPITIAFDISLVNTSANIGDPYSPWFRVHSVIKATTESATTGAASASANRLPGRQDSALVLAPV